MEDRRVLALHVPHVESAEMHCVARERGWRRNTDLEVLRASGVGEVMGTDEVIPE